MLPLLLSLQLSAAEKSDVAAGPPSAPPTKAAERQRPVGGRPARTVSRAEEIQMSWVNPPANPAPGIRYLTYHSAAMKTEVGYAIWLPPDYDKSEARYPVLYWLHGAGGNGGNASGLAQRMAELMAGNDLRPMIIVFIEGGLSRQVRTTLYSDSADGRHLTETTFIRELIPHIDQTYRTVAAKKGRAIEGFSAGGFGAVQLGLKHPELFCSIVSYGGALHDAETIARSRPDIFQPVFNGDVALFQKNSPWEIAQTGRQENRPRLRLVVGTEDQTLEMNRRFHQKLDELGVAHEFEEVAGVRHNHGAYYQTAGLAGLRFHARSFEMASASAGGPGRSQPAASPGGGDPRALSLDQIKQRQAATVEFLPDLAYREGNPAWRLDLALPKERGAAPRPAVVVIHGGGWTSGDKRVPLFAETALYLAERGYVAASINYRLAGEAPFPACLEDVKCAIRWLRAHATDYGIDPARIAATGASAGAHLAALAGLVPPEAGFEGDGPYRDQSSAVQAVCAAATPSDFLNSANPGASRPMLGGRLLQGPPETLLDRARAASPVTYARASAPPFLIIHGTEDKTVPIDQAGRLVKALRDAGAKWPKTTYMILDGAGHGVFSSQAVIIRPAMVAFFAEAFGASSSTKP